MESLLIFYPILSLKPDTFTRPPTQTKDQKKGAEVGFSVLPVWTIYMRVVVVSSLSVAGRPCADLITDLAVVTLTKFWHHISSF